MRYRIFSYLFLLIALSDIVRQVYGHPSELKSIGLDIDFYGSIVLASIMLILDKLENFNITVILFEDDNQESDK